MVKITLDLDTECHQLLRLMADKEKRSMRNMLLVLIEKTLKKEEKKENNTSSEFIPSSNPFLNNKLTNQ